MCEKRVNLNRRNFLKTTAQFGAFMALPQLIPGTALGKDGGVAPSERIVLGGDRYWQSRRLCVGVFPA